jgi:hypothetical protein
MRKLFALLFVLGLVTMTAQASFAQDGEQENTDLETAAEAVDSTMEDAAMDTTAAMAEEAAPAEEMSVDATEEVVEEPGGFQVLKEKFIEGGY